METPRRANSRVRRITAVLLLLMIGGTAYADACQKRDLDYALLEQGMQWIESDATHVDGILIQHCGELVIERYMNGYDRESLHDLQSATKTFSAILIGIAIDQGLIRSTNQRIRKLLPNHEGLLTDRKKRITVRHLLEMTSGLRWVDFGPERSFERQAAADDSVAFILGERLRSTPGKSWFYNTGSSHLLSAIVREVSQRPTAEFADEYLFEPLGIERYRWGAHRDGVHEGGWQLYTRPIDALKFGQMLLDGGIFDGKRIVSESFVDDATSIRQRTTSENSAYGYQMWIETDHGPDDLAGARGYGGQNIFVAQDLNTVIVTTGSIRYPQAAVTAIRKFMRDFVTPAHR